MLDPPCPASAAAIIKWWWWWDDGWIEEGCCCCCCCCRMWLINPDVWSTDWIPPPLLLFDRFGFLGEVLFDRRSIGVSRLLFSRLFFLFPVADWTAGSLLLLLDGTLSETTDKTGLFLFISLFFRSAEDPPLLLDGHVFVVVVDVVVVGGSAPIWLQVWAKRANGLFFESILMYIMKNVRNSRSNWISLVFYFKKLP